MNIVEMGRLKPIIQEQTEIPQTRNEQVQGLRDGTKAKQRTAMGLTRTAVSGPRGALSAACTAQRTHDGAHDGKRERTVRCESTWCADHRCNTPSDMLTDQPKRACLSREVHGQRGDGRN